MKKICTVLMIALFIAVHGTGTIYGTDTGDFNIFLERKIIVGPLENLGDEKYGYLYESLRDQLALLISDAPFIVPTDQERAFLYTLSLKEEYEKAFAQTEGKILYRMSPFVLKGELNAEDFPFHVFGSYLVYKPEGIADAILDLRIDVYNTITGTERDSIHLEGTLSDYIDAPREFLYPFLPQFLRYTIHRATFTAEPLEALIFVDDRLMGIGEARNILVTPGLHRLTVKSEGYLEYRDLVQVTEDGFTRHVTLQKEQRLIRYLITSTPEAAQVYLDEKYQGETPISIAVSPSNRTLTLSKEGYRTESVAVQNLPLAGGSLNFGLIEAGIDKELREKADRHQKRSRVLAWTGLGVLGSSIFFGVMSTLKQQEADLYQGSDPGRSADAQKASNLYTTFLYSSLVLAGGIFTISFVETVQYFKIYNQVTEYEQIPLVRAEVTF